MSKPKKLYTVKTIGPIYGMDNISGPLTTPSPLKFNAVVDMVRAGYEIYEHNPVNHAEKVRVTISNVNSIEFKTTRGAGMMARMKNRKAHAGMIPKHIPVKEVKAEEDKKVAEVKEDSKEENKEDKNKKNNKYTQMINENAKGVNKPDVFEK